MKRIDRSFRAFDGQPNAVRLVTDRRGGCVWMNVRHDDDYDTSTEVEVTLSPRTAISLARAILKATGEK